MKNLNLIVLYLLFVHTTSFAQKVQRDLKYEPIISDSLKEDVIIPELNVYIDYAIKNSPLLMATDLEIDQILEKVKLEKKSWFDFIYFDGNGRYGFFDQLTLSQQTTTSLDPTGIKLANQQFNYYFGISLKLPLSNFMNRKNQINILKYSQKASESRKDELKKELTLSIIEEYYKLKNLQESLVLLQEVAQTYEISFLKSTKDLESGMLDLNQYAVIVSYRATAKASYIKAKNDFYSLYYKLQAITGLNLNNK